MGTIGTSKTEPIKLQDPFALRGISPVRAPELMSAVLRSVKA